MTEQPEMIDGRMSMVDAYDGLIQAELHRVKYLRQAEERRCWHKKILECDEAFTEYCASVSGLKYGPFVRASTYPGKWCQPVGDAFKYDSDPRRPVVMRGALNLMKSKWAAQSTYAKVVTHKYLRRIGFTAFCREETRAMRRIVCDHMRKRNHYVHDADALMATAFFNPKESQAWIKGKFRFLPPGEWAALRKLHAPSIIIRRKKHELILHPRELEASAAAPLTVAESIAAPDYKLTLKQKKTAAYRALKELGIHI